MLKFKLSLRRFLYNFHLMFTAKRDYEKQVRLIVKYDPLNILN